MFNWTICSHISPSVSPLSLLSDPKLCTEANMRLQTGERDVSTVCLKFYVYIKCMSGKMIEQKEREEEALTLDCKKVARKRKGGNGGTERK